MTTNEQANCDDWTKILLHCRECGVQFQRKVKGQRYCEEHRHLAGEVIRPQDTPTSNRMFPVTDYHLKQLRDDGYAWVADEIELLRSELETLKSVARGAVQAARREYHANGTYWSGVPTVDIPCDFCRRPIMDHDPRTHACPTVKASETPQHDFRGPTVACRCGWFGHPNALVGLKCPKCSAEFK